MLRPPVGPYGAWEVPPLPPFTIAFYGLKLMDLVSLGVGEAGASRERCVSDVLCACVPCRQLRVRMRSSLAVYIWWCRLVLVSGTGLKCYL